MPEYLAPGVYIEEVERGPVPIEGVSTSTAGFVGLTRWGRTEGRPELVVNFRDFERKFGGYFKPPANTFAGHNMLPFAVEAFFANGGQRLYIMRVVSDDAAVAAASAQAQGGVISQLLEDAPDSATNKSIRVASLRGFQKGTKVTLTKVVDGATVTSGATALTVDTIDRATNTVTFSAAIGAGFPRDTTTVYSDINGLDTATALPTVAAAGPVLPPRPSGLNSFTITAKDKGAWGNDLVIEAFPDPNPAGRATYTGFDGHVVASNEATIQVASTAGFYPGAWVEIDRGNSRRYYLVNSVSGTKLRLRSTAVVTGTDFGPANDTIVSTCEFVLLASVGDIAEEYRGLTLQNVPGRYYFDRINLASGLITVGNPPGATHPILFPIGDDGRRIKLGGGNDGANPPSANAYVGKDNGPGKRSGIRALEDVDEISIIGAPGRTEQTVQQALIGQCQDLKDRFAILDPVAGAGGTGANLTEITTQRKRYDTRYAAIYYPRVMMPDPLAPPPDPLKPDETGIPVPPSGHIAGIYARTDVNRGVHKAPANEVIDGILGLEQTITKREQDILNPLNVNVLRDFRADRRGYRVWGSRVLTSHPLWKYVPVRRLFIFLEESLDEGTQFVVFEPNDIPLWARVIQTVSIFLTRVWRDGALAGATPEEAFFVQCGPTTMSTDDILNGRLIMEVGVAPVRPAEFVVIRISQKIGGSDVEEL